MEIERRWSPLIAAVLSLFIPGLGQLYKSQFLIAVIWFVAVAVGYWLLIIPGLILHVFCIYFAAFGKPK